MGANFGHRNCEGLRRFVTALLLCLVTALAHADDGPADPRPSERGLPTVTVVPPGHLGAPQVFAVSVAGRRLYVGTLTGLAIHDGAHWETVASPRALYAVHAASTGRVVAGGPDSLLELARDAQGQRHFVSLTDRLPEADRAIGDVRSVHVFGDIVFAVTDRALVRVQGPVARIVEHWRSDPRRRGFTSQGVLYVVSQGAVRAFAPEGAPVSDPLTAHDPGDGLVTAVADHPTAGQVVAIDARGVFAVRDGTWTRVGLGAGARLLRGLTDVRALASGALALGSDVDGVVLLTPDLEFDRALGRAEGLPSGHVESLAEDAEGGVWVVNPAQLSRVDFGTPLTLIDTRLGLEGTVNGVARHRGRLHVLTTSGLFALADAHGRRRAVPVPGVTARAWHAFDAGDHLLVATAGGIYESRATAARLVPGTARLSAYVLAPRVDRPDVMLVGSRTGLSLLAREGRGWRFLKHVPGAPRYVRTIVTRPGGVVYLGTTFDGVVRLRLDDATAPTTLLAGETQLRDIDGALHVLDYASRTLSVLDEARGVLTPVDLRGATLPEHLVRFAYDRRGALWATGRGVELLEPGQTAMRPVLDRGVSVQALDIEDDGVVWLGSNAGLWRFAGARAAPPPSRPLPSVERVFVNGRPAALTRSNGAPLDLAFGFERLRLEFTANTFAPDAVTSFKLEPLDQDWSPARHGLAAEYTALREGRYRLRLRAGAGPTRSESEFAFVVRPPWYRTPLVYILEIALAGGLLLLVSQVRTHHLRRRSHELEWAVIEQTAALQEANRRLAALARSDELTALYNRRHFEDALTEEWARAHRTRSPIALVMVDIDHFKSLNDTLGHVAGDRALRAVADVIKRCARRPGDVAARYGGEEFVVLLPGGRRERLHALAEEIREAVEALALPHPGHALGRVTVSVGVAAVTAPDGPQATLVDAADRALYRAKAAGRNAVAA